MDYDNKIKGSLLGGAAGDALGYSVEFLTENEIFNRYGRDGITSYDCDSEKGAALISDDTQMTLFTANGILRGETIKKMRGTYAEPSAYAAEAYMDWYCTQNGEKSKNSVSWLADIKDLYACRAPGMTCLSALRSGKAGSMDKPLNMSKGCGGIMRVAPIGLLYDTGAYDIKWIDRQGAEAAAVTHGHPLGYIPAAALVHIVNLAVYGSFGSLREIAVNAAEAVSDMFPDDKHTARFRQLMDTAVRLSENNDSDISNIHRLGEGWVAEETLAIAVYCSLRYADDFSKGIIAAVNHNGDSDSTGAVAGNILGAWLGCGAIDEKWKQKLELFDVIMETADDLCKARNMICGTCENIIDTDWERKYFRV